MEDHPQERQGSRQAEEPGLSVEQLHSPTEAGTARPAPAGDRSYRSLYVRWVGANTLAEFLGLGSSLALGAGLFIAGDGEPLATALFYALGIAALSAAIEGTAVGGLQWLVLRRVIPALDGRRYIVATALGAFVAWVLGMVPSTVLSAGAEAAGDAGSAAAFDPSLGLQMLMAVGMGLALGPFLGVPQWVVLRQHLPRAGWWVAANATAWALGMPMVFLGTSLIAEDSSAWTIALAVGAGVAAAGAVVGLIHGLWLVWLVRMRDDLANEQA